MIEKLNKILVTGVAGFIGFHVAKRLAIQGYHVVGFDNINNYYDVNLKYARLNELGISRNAADSGIRTTSKKFPNLQFIRLSLEDRSSVEKLFDDEKFDIVCHLAAQAGVRYSLENPYAYADSNLLGFLNILEGCRHSKIKHLVYASSSSVYGLNEKMPLSTNDSVNHPVSLYAATKKANELMAHSYSHLFNLPTTGLRFFTVYGPWGRPDMSPILFANAIQTEKAIKIFNHGKMMRDFTYIDDIVNGVMNVIFSPATGEPNWDGVNPNPAASKAPYQIYNIGNSTPIELMHFIETIEKTMGKTAIKEYVDMQPGDVLKTFADMSPLENKFNYHPQTSLKEGIQIFIKWYNDYYH
jgi:UDP-glucuronate 4-epimerase